MVFLWMCARTCLVVAKATQGKMVLFCECDQAELHQGRDIHTQDVSWLRLKTRFAVSVKIVK